MSQSLRIVVIDDGRDARRSCEILLGRLGHEIRTAETATEGLSVCQEFRPQVVICDIRLPGEMSGHDVARALRQDAELSRAFLIAQTGFSGDEHVEASLAAGFDLHLKKPVDFARLTEILGGIAEGGEQSAES